jgi:hypothetical protein
MCETAQKEVPYALPCDSPRNQGEQSMSASDDRQWYHVFIDHPRIVDAINVTFHSLLIETHRQVSQPTTYRVYRTGNATTGYSYFFCPEAGHVFKSLITLWGGVGVSEPTNVQNMERLISTQDRPSGGH